MWLHTYRLTSALQGVVDKENHKCGYIHIDLPELYKVFVDKENHDGMENHRCGYNLSSLSYKAEHNVHSPFDSHPI